MGKWGPAYMYEAKPHLSKPAGGRRPPVFPVVPRARLWVCRAYNHRFGGQSEPSNQAGAWQASSGAAICEHSGRETASNQGEAGAA